MLDRLRRSGSRARDRRRQLFLHSILMGRALVFRHFQLEGAIVDVVFIVLMLILYGATHWVVLAMKQLQGLTK
jgi:hypothetical protein